MAAEFEDNYGGENIDVEVRVLPRKDHNPYLSFVCTKVQSTDDFVDAFTNDPAEIEVFFRQIREAEAEYRRLTQSDGS